MMLLVSQVTTLSLVKLQQVLAQLQTEKKSVELVNITTYIAVLS